MDEPQQQSSEPKEPVIAPSGPALVSEPAQESTAKSAVAQDSIVESSGVQAQHSKTSQNLESEKNATEPIEPVKPSEPVSRPMTETQVDAGAPAAEAESGSNEQSAENKIEPVHDSSEKVSLSQPEVQERVIEKVIEKTVPRELNEEEQQGLYRSRLKFLSVKGNQSRSNRRLANHQKIIEYLKQHGYITNREVEKICEVKDSTATRYLKDLQSLGQIIPLGQKRGIRWRLVHGIWIKALSLR